MKRGYTLIELMTVLAIILILAALILTAATKAILAAQRTACAEMRRQIEIARHTDHPATTNTTRHLIKPPPPGSRCYNCHATEP